VAAEQAAKAIRDYLSEIQKNLSRGNATEHTHRPALKALIEAFAPGITATNEPKHVECGAPDFVVSRKASTIGYIEAKDVGASLDEAERSEQLKRYLSTLSNLILTDYFEFRWYTDGSKRATARLGVADAHGKIKKDVAGAEAASSLFADFLAHQPEPIASPKELALRMARLAHMIRDLIVAAYEREEEGGALHAQLKAFQEVLIPDLVPPQFADMYAQTIAYGLFAARCTTGFLTGYGSSAKSSASLATNGAKGLSGAEFSREHAAYMIPKTNPFLRKLFDQIAGPELDNRIAWLVDDLVQVLRDADMAAILKDFGKKSAKEDPVVHFYETFLTAYDPRVRETRGVYYTPEPVVSYIVRSIDYLLKTRFDRPLGLADDKVLILDPAVGTGTFLYYVVNEIYNALKDKGQAGAWNDYVAKKLLPRIFGFELLMAPYAVAHLKLGLRLRELGYGFEHEERLGVYLTNTLEEAIKKSEVMFAQWIAEEANAANRIKRDLPIMVVLGNPPYSVSSANKGEHIERLMERYKAAVRTERNIQPLSDDYIKFIRFAHERIERTGFGVIGMITNHSYLSGLIHRGMREELAKSFSEIYLLNLHGNTQVPEKVPDDRKDQNVFDIRQGVAIALFVRTPSHTGLTHVEYADLWGLRQEKHQYLLANDVSTTEWHRIRPEASQHFFFVPKELGRQAEFGKYWSMIEVFGTGRPQKDRGKCWGLGVKTNRDKLLVDFDRQVLEDRIQTLADATVSDEEVKSRLGLRDSRYWNTTRERQKIRATDWRSSLSQYCYRPLDFRWILYQPNLIEIGRGGASKAVMCQMRRENLALLTMRRIRTEPYCHFLVTRYVANKDAVSVKDNCVVFPLYLCDDFGSTEKTLFGSRETVRRPNLSPELVAAVEHKLGLKFVADGKGDLQSTFGPESILGYAYGLFHSPVYRERYAEFLKIDFPRLPLTSNKALFKILADKGEQLVALHLMESPSLNTLITSFPVAGPNEVEKVQYAEPHRDEQGKQVPGRVYINKTQYFEGVEPDLWPFHIGGYQVLDKWLKDRKGRTLSWDDIQHYQKIVVAIKETIRLMKEIDELIPKWPVE